MSNRRSNQNWRIATGFYLACFVFCAGCGGTPEPDPPPTYSVGGTVYDAQGKPLKGGIIQFMSEANPQLTMSAMISDDGSYELKTIYGNRNLDGAIEGNCKVLVTPSFAGGEIPKTTVLSKLYRVEPRASKIDVRLE